MKNAVHAIVSAVLRRGGADGLAVGAAAEREQEQALDCSRSPNEGMNWRIQQGDGARRTRVCPISQAVGP
jgi:hypothetical protein